jgi:hypothetical protein
LSLRTLSSDILIWLDLLDAQRQSLPTLLPSFVSLEIGNDLPRLLSTLQFASVNAFRSDRTLLTFVRQLLANWRMRSVVHSFTRSPHES